MASTFGAQLLIARGTIPTNLGLFLLRMIALLKSVSLLVLAAVVAAVALLIPAHLRSVDRAVLEHAASVGPSLSEKIELELAAANTGPATRILEATKGNGPEEFASRIEVLIEENPSFAVSGGPDPVFDDFLDLVAARDFTGGRNAALSILLPRAERASLSRLLGESRNTNVAALLRVRDLPGLIRLHPGNHPAGAPYDAGVLALALLIEGSHFDSAVAQQIGELARQADLGNPSAVNAFENLVIATLSTGRQLDFRSLAQLADLCASPRDWAQIAALFRTRPDNVSKLFAAIRFDDSPERLYAYLAAHGDAGVADLSTSLSLGPGAVRHLLAGERPIYEAFATTRGLLRMIEPYRPAFLSALTFSSRDTALLLKFVAFALAGLAFAFAMGAAWRGGIESKSEISRLSPAVIARDGLISIVFALTLWTIFEPEILKTPETESEAGPRIEFALTGTLESIKSPVRIMQELNQVTLLVLVLFFVIQLVIYSFCLIKLREVAKQKLAPNMKLRLLDNEEHLFDFGLYVGLGGTVLSLILVAVGVVEASLMAAYASTLFGILFVAILKVLHLRPFRKRLILEAGSSQDAPQAGALMKNIEL